MKILHVNCNYLDSMLHQTMINTLSKYGVENEVFVPIYSVEGHVVKTLEKYVKATVCFNKVDRFAFHIKQSKIYRAIKKSYNISSFDCLHAYTVFTDGNVTRKLSVEYGIPYVVAVRNTDVNTFFKYMVHLRSTGVNVLRDASAIFFLSSTYKKEVLENYVPQELRQEIERKSYIVPNGIDEFWHNNKFVDRPYGKIVGRFKEKKLNLLYVGDIDHNKNVEETCETIKILQNKGWKIEFDVVGQIKSWSAFNRIKSLVEYHQRQPKEKLIEYFRKADIFVMPSHTETFGLVYVEAMSQGLPIIYTRGQGFDGQFREGEVGYAVSDSAPDELAERIVSCVENYEKISMAGLQGVSKYRWNRICEWYQEKYNEILKI